MPITGNDDRLDTPEEHRLNVQQHIAINLTASIAARDTIREAVEQMRASFDQIPSEPIMPEEQESILEWFSTRMEMPEYEALYQGRFISDPVSVYCLIRECDPVENIEPRATLDGQLVEIIARGTLTAMRDKHHKDRSSGYVPLSSLEVD